MPWILVHYPAGSEWEKTFDTEAEALAELYRRLCGTCIKGCLGCQDEEDCNKHQFCTKTPPDPSTAGDLLSTPCGCEYGLHFEDR